MEREARGLSRLGMTFDLILTSPMRRASQTAAIVARSLGLAGVTRPTEALRSGCRMEGLRGMLGQSRGAPPGDVLLVGHAPDLGRIAADLVGVRAPLSLRRGGMCCVEVASWPPSPPGTLVYLLPPEVLRALGDPA